MREFNASDPWSMSPWSPPQMVNPNIPGIQPPKPPSGPRAPRQKRAVPAIDELYDIQRDLIQAIRFMKDFEEDHPHEIDTHFRRMATNLKNSYRILNRYLKRWDSPGGAFN